MNTTTASTPPPSKTTPAHYAYIDALRGIAFLLVLVVHIADCLVYSGYYPAVGHRTDLLFGDGRFGVQLFYVISAFTLASSAASRRGKEEHPTRNFFIRRLFRIAPLFWLAIVFYELANPVRYFHQALWAPEGVHWWHIALTALFLHGFYPTTVNSVVPGGWSVGVEMLFYCLVPWLASRLTSLKRAAAATVLALGIAFVADRLLWRYVGVQWTGDWANAFANYVYYWLPTQMPVFLLGFVLFHLFKSDAGKAGGKTRSLLLIGVSAALMMIGTFVLPNNQSTREVIPAHFVFGVAFFLLAWALRLQAWPVLVNPVTRYIGKVSYSCYLVHFAVVYILISKIAHHVSVPQSHLREYGMLLVWYVIAAAITVGIASLTYRYVEEPGVEYGKRLIDRLK